MVNIDRIIDDYSKSKDDKIAFDKLVTFPYCHKMPQKEDDSEIYQYLRNIIDEKLPNEKKQAEINSLYKSFRR